MKTSLTRRRALAALGSGVTASLAGCTGGGPLLGGGSAADGPPADTGVNRGPPTTDDERYFPHDFSNLRGEVVSGGVRKDGIPSVDDPEFKPASESDLRDDAIVFGLARDGDVRAYPQHVLVHHEIVNDVIADTAIAVTYCPLTGTAMGFERGVTTFGVSGRLLNNNLVMYDRGTDSRWPQILGTAIRGKHEGERLREFRLVWTTWGAWKEAHPETSIMTTETGYARRYGRDPYGGYNPDTGYYENGPPMFGSLHEDDRASAKRVVMGTRTADGAIAFDKPTLRRNGVRSGTLGPDGETEYVAVYDPRLDTGYVYANPEGVEVAVGSDERYEVGGESFTADSLPLARQYTFDAMWHAWAGFYPETSYVR
jgi:hypothetical protein